MKKGVFKFIPKRLKSKHHIGGNVPSSGIYECSICGNYTAFRKGEMFTRCEDCPREKRDEQNQWYVTNLVIHFMSKNLNIEYERLQGFQIKVADRITEFAGTMGFVYFHVVWFAFWILGNAGAFGSWGVFDPFPYRLLTMIVSLEAIFLATLIMISQNIANQRNELRAENDYRVNLKTEKEVAELLTMMREMREWQESSVKKKERKSIGKKVREDKILAEAGIDNLEKSAAIG